MKHTADRACAEKPALRTKQRTPKASRCDVKARASHSICCLLRLVSCFGSVSLFPDTLAAFLFFSNSVFWAMRKRQSQGFPLNLDISSVVKIAPPQPSENISQYAPPCPVKTSFPPLQNPKPYCMQGDTLPSICFANPTLPFYVRSVTIPEFSYLWSSW